MNTHLPFKSVHTYPQTYSKHHPAPRHFPASIDRDSTTYLWIARRLDLQSLRGTRFCYGVVLVPASPSWAFPSEAKRSWRNRIHAIIALMISICFSSLSSLSYGYGSRLVLAICSLLDFLSELASPVLLIGE
ncbi:hypothetical protein BU24DRAFT_231924 [Aaosphaeria arxii CBS 175.79]|uniref:Uncharacterized protein n=1 Tax=Aaosphaeria arxii CBS 175.79 TaxID=1450172 RepID=A0A6A5XJR6_9PLEO|nr:uncharacterized protein BU24DRAFT_231924 [Aaosphaeria arxii CBS 175.79]KAF2013193.1 hypothetical protein BU24DRAFT_231924 [Aaosphaeria arxii CBS 175.79]